MTGEIPRDRPRPLTPRAARERALKDARDRMTKVSADVEATESARIEKTAAELLASPERIPGREREQSVLTLSRLQKMSVENTKTFNPPLLATLRRMPEWNMVEPMVQALQTAPPPEPARGDEVDEPDEALRRYIIVQNCRAPANPDDIRPFGIHLHPRIFQDKETVEKLIAMYAPRPPEYQGNAELTAALTTLKERLNAFIALDTMRQLQYDRSLQMSYVNERFGQMGKLLAVLGLGAYALVDGIVAFANGRPPTTGLLAGLGVAMIADGRVRETMGLTPVQQVQLGQVSAVLTGFQSYASRYEFYGHDGAWATIFERLMENRDETDAFLKEFRGLRDPELRRKQATEFVQSLTGQAPDRWGRIGQHLMTMIQQQPATRTARTDFENLVTMLRSPTSDEARDAVLRIVHLRATGRMRGAAPIATPARPPRAGEPA